MTVPSAVGGDAASSGVQRVMAVTLQIAALILLALNLPNTVSQARWFPWWWTDLSLASVVVPALVTLVAAAWPGTRLLRRLCGIQAVAMVLALFIAPVALDGAFLPFDMGMPWLRDLAVIAGAAAAVAWSPIVAAIANLALQAAVFLNAIVTVPVGSRSESLGNAFIGVFFVTLFAALAAALGRAGRDLDAAMQEAITEAATAATAEASRTARRRVAALIHDSVIVALLAYADQRVDRSTARAEATRALAAIEQLEHPMRPADRGPTELAWELQAITTELDPEAVFDYETIDDGVIPAAVATAIVEATTEALRNSIRHARLDPPVNRQVNAHLTASEARVVILDDGDGFELSEVPQSRLGIRRGIIARMSSVPGGSARVTGTRGRGTIVELRWSGE